MRLVSFEEGNVQSVGVMIGDAAFVDLRETGLWTEGMRALLELPEGERSAVLKAALDVTTSRQLSEVSLLPVVPGPHAIWAMALNYTTHAAEGGWDLPKHPMLFMRLPSSMVGHDRLLVKPRASAQFDYEGELAVVIGKAGRNIAVEQVLDHIFGYACANDGSVREWQKHTSQVTAGKNFEESGSVGPWLVTKDDVPDIKDRRLVTRLNGAEMQQTRVGDMLFSIETVLSYISDVTTLRPGDIILMGTPSGVGFRRNPQIFMREGDVIEVEIDGIGILRNGIAER